MILRLMPEAVSRQWGELNKMIAKSLPADERSDTTLTNILEGVMRNQLFCWVSYDSQSGNGVNFVFVLAPLIDPFKGENNLLLYTITRVQSIDKELTVRMYQEGYVALKKFMTKHGYHKLVGFINEDNNGLVKRAKGFGAELRWRACQ